MFSMKALLIPRSKWRIISQTIRGDTITKIRDIGQTTIRTLAFVLAILCALVLSTISLAFMELLPLRLQLLLASIVLLLAWLPLVLIPLVHSTDRITLISTHPRIHRTIMHIGDKNGN